MGFNVIHLDIRYDLFQDVRYWQPPHELIGNTYGVLAAPPCTEFAISGARWWATKPPQALSDAIDVVRGCLRIIKAVQPRWWALENPKGRLKTCVPELGNPTYYFQPWEYEDFHVKLTYIWGGTTKPPRPKDLNPYMARELAKQHPYDVQHTAKHPDRDLLRGATPPGFSQAFAHHMLKTYPPAQRRPNITTPPNTSTNSRATQPYLPV